MRKNPKLVIKRGREGTLTLVTIAYDKILLTSERFLSLNFVSTGQEATINLSNRTEMAKEK